MGERNQSMNLVNFWRKFAIVGAMLTITVIAVACASGDGNATQGSELNGSIAIDGSSTVFPITEAMAEEFSKANQKVRVTVGISGTGGGFKKFCAGEIDFNDASRPVKSSELKACADNGVEFIEMPVAFDGLSVVVNPANDWVDHLTIAELKAIWEPESQIKRWNQIRPEWPDEEIKLVGADTDSGTFDYFTNAIVGEEGASRSDYTWSTDDNVLIEAVAGEKYALGYFGYAYYVENTDRLKLVAVDGGEGPILPNAETVNTGAYQPLSRPLLVYVNKESAERPVVKAFVEFYLSQETRPLVSDVGYIPLPDRAYELILERFQQGVTGSLFAGGSQTGVTIEDILEQAE
jgi:phosphate transport system substrate-binding protein